MGGEFVSAELFVQRALVISAEALPAVLAREGDARQAGIEQPALDLPVVLEIEPLLLLAEVQQRRAVLLVGAQPAQVGLDPGARPLPEILDGFKRFAHAESFPALTSRAARRCRCSGGVP